MAVSNDLLDSIVRILFSFEEQGYRFASFEVKLSRNDAIRLRIEGTAPRNNGEERICREEVSFNRDQWGLVPLYLGRLLAKGLPHPNAGLSEEEASTS